MYSGKDSLAYSLRKHIPVALTATLTHTSVVIEQYPLSSAAAVDCAIWSKETQVTTTTIQNPAWR